MSIDTETRAYLCQLENPTVARPPRRGRGRLAFGGSHTRREHSSVAGAPQCLCLCQRHGCRQSGPMEACWHLIKERSDHQLHRAPVCTCSAPVLHGRHATSAEERPQLSLESGHSSARVSCRQCQSVESNSFHTSCRHFGAAASRPSTEVCTTLETVPC